MREADVAMFRGVLDEIGEPVPLVVARVSVAELGRMEPGLLICDVDALERDPLERLRQMRFVLAECVVAIYTDRVGDAWTRACHLAGANGVLSRTSSERALAIGLRRAIRTGCYTDPSCVRREERRRSSRA